MVGLAFVACRRYRPRGVRPVEKACQQHCQNTGKEDPIEGSRAANRGYRRVEPLHLLELEEIGPDLFRSGLNCSRWK